MLQILVLMACFCHPILVSIFLPISFQILLNQVEEIQSTDIIYIFFALNLASQFSFISLCDTVQPLLWQLTSISDGGLVIVGST